MKLDVRNAFISLDLTKLLKAIKEKMPEYFPLFLQSCRAPTVLLTDIDTIYCETGVQQGDPIGPAGYRATTHDAHQDLQSGLTIGFLDDDVIVGEPAT